MNNLDIPDDILDAANLVSRWMRSNRTPNLGPIQLRGNIMQYVDLIDLENEGSERIWTTMHGSGVWLYPGEGIAVVNVRELRKMSE